jgi:hypothetical protein
MDAGSTEGRISGVRGVICSLVVSVIAAQKALQTRKNGKWEISTITDAWSV